jgi:WD40 repeat protein
VSRRVVLGGGVVGAAAIAWFTRESWLPGSEVGTLSAAKVVSFQATIRDAEFDPLRRSFVLGGAGGKASIFSLAGGSLPGADDYRLDGHEDTVVRTVFAPGRDRSRLLTVSIDGKALIWDDDRSRAPMVLKSGRPSLAAGWQRYGTRVAIGGNDVTLWDTDSGKLVTRIEGHKAPILDIAFAIWGDVLATASADGTAQLWDAEGGWHLATLNGNAGPVLSVAISPKDGHVVTVSKDNTAIVWVWASLGPLTSTVLQGGKEIVSAQFSPDGAQIVTAAADGTADLWNVQGDRITALEGHAGALTSARFSPDGALIVTTSADRTARLWSRDTHEPVAILAGHTNTVTGAKFSPDGNNILTWSDDLSARLWNVPAGLRAAT